MRLRNALIAAAVVSVLWTIACVGLAWHFGLPEPAIHDEFGYLLGADTFLHGRLVNPAHPMARFFDAPQIFVTPVYASKYPPAQSMFLALGIRLFGHAWYGVALSGALAMFFLASDLMLDAGLMAGVAVASLVGLSLLPPMYWAWSYWGGFVAMAGSAAILLSIHLMRRQKAVSAGVIFGVAVSVLFLSRPYEGGIVAASLLIVEGRSLLQAGGRRLACLSAALPILACLIFTGLYDRAVTGNIFELPHLFHDRYYSAIPNFWMLPPPDPHITNPRVAALQGRESGEFQQYMTERNSPLRRAPRETLESLQSVLGWSALPLVLLVFAWRNRSARRLATALLLAFAGLCLTTFHLPHYAAPLIPIIAALMACVGLESCRSRIGRIVTVCVFACAFGLTLKSIFVSWSHRPQGRLVSVVRPELIHRLSDMDGDHLVIVRYPSATWRVDDEYVHNSADIDSQKIVFARDLGPQEDAILSRHYASRRKWLLTLSEGSVHLEPYFP